MKKEFDKNQKLTAVLAIVIFVFVMAVLTWLIGGPVLRFAGEPERFRLWVEHTGSAAPLAYMGLVIAQILQQVLDLFHGHCHKPTSPRSSHRSSTLRVRGGNSFLSYLFRCTWVVPSGWGHVQHSSSRYQPLWP